ncbi:PilN domain-containing protein [Chamaesiphon sp. VAR_48_metabat_135_sub]|uniref:PilN domain-containing protein n=1 Tax=Chamaesiphon sp. VAR_48_metabat_135_sub TaxID=2964699 RepID=UPI00286B1110|nr:PilN domain-containing protein [Chamaesiphon sp. VAR_48_metabat_135_sub]
MYSLDINLLRERSEYQTGEQSEFINNTNIAPPKYGKIPLFVGAGLAALSLLATGAGWMFLGQQTTQLEAKQKELDQKLGSLLAQDRRLEQLNGQVAQINDETQSLASVFNQIQPWSAVLQDLRESIPQGVQIAGVAQSEIKPPVAVAPAAPAPKPPSGGLINKISTVPNPDAKPTPNPTPAAAGTPAPAPALTPGSTATATLPADVPTTKLDIMGTAKSFEEVNNFILTLKQSAFFNPDDTQLISAGLAPATALTKVPVATGPLTTTEKTAQERLNRLELPKVVEYKIQTSLKRIPAADLIRELERKGAVGLVTRLRSLQQQQAIKP